LASPGDYNQLQVGRVSNVGLRASSESRSSLSAAGMNLMT